MAKIDYRRNSNLMRRKLPSNNGLCDDNDAQYVPAVYVLRLVLVFARKGLSERRRSALPTKTEKRPTGPSHTQSNV